MEGHKVLFGLKGANNTTLYGNFTQFCDLEGQTVITPRRFREDLENYLQSKASFNVSIKKTKNGLALMNVALKNTYEDNSF